MTVLPTPNIQALIELARRDGVDIRPTLVRVLTDLFVQEREHTPAEQSRFAELVCRLLEGVDAATRAAVAERLADYPGTPAVVALRLAHDEIGVAGAILRRSPVLSEMVLHSILDSAGKAHAAAIRERDGLPPAIRRRLDVRQRILAREQRGVPSEEEAAPVDALGFFVAEEAGRREIIAAMAKRAPAAGEDRLSRAGVALIERLERAALRHRPGEFAAALQQALGLSAGAAHRISGDPEGHALLVLCKAIHAPAAVASRILLFLDPESGRTLERVFALTEGYAKIDETAACRLVLAWSEALKNEMPEADPAPRRGVDERIARETGEAERKTPAAAARRAAERR